ncbi:MAG: glycosyltransferase family 10 domain-containing protein [Halobacteriaceae archaeon]
MTNRNIRVYFDVDFKSSEVWYEELLTYSPGTKGVWENIKAVTDPEKGEYHVCFNQPTDKVSSEKLVLFCREPPVSQRCEWQGVDALAKYPTTTYPMIQLWWLDKTYDDLKTIEPENISKTKDLSWITTDKGKIQNRVVKGFRRIMLKTGFRKYESKPAPLRLGGLDGHIMRMEFLERLTDHYPDILDLYGRGSFEGEFYNGEIEKKWEGLAPYRYSLAIENYKGENYFSEKIADALLAWCMPIYWGCTNLDDYLPSNSYIWIDIENKNAPNRVKEIVNSNIREQNLEAIAEARRRILDEYQIFPRTQQAISETNY